MHHKEPLFSQLSVHSEQPNVSLFGGPDNSAPILRFICASVQRLANIGGFHWIACVGCLQQFADFNQRFACGWPLLAVAPVCSYIHGLQRYANIRSLQRFANIRSLQRFANIRSLQRFANIRSLQQFANIRSWQRFANIQSFQRFTYIRSLQRFANIRSLQRFANIRSLQKFANIGSSALLFSGRSVSMALRLYWRRAVHIAKLRPKAERRVGVATGGLGQPGQEHHRHQQQVDEHRHF